MTPLSSSRNSRAGWDRRPAAWTGLLVAAAALATPAGAQNWPQWRGPTTLGHSAEKGLPVTWGGKDNANVLWKAELPKSHNPASSPIVFGDRVFVTTTLGKPVEHHVLCFRASDGKPLWDSPVEPGPWVLTDLRGGYGAPTPATDGQHVFVVFGSAVIAALDYDGKIAWRKPFERYNFDVAMGGSPILYNDTLIYQADQTKNTSSLIAFDKKTGAVKWEQMRPKVSFTHCSPALAQVKGKAMLLVSASSGLQGVDPNDGKLLWWATGYGDVPTPSFGGGLVYVDSGRGGTAGVCVDPAGEGDVSATHVRWKLPQVPETFGSAIIVGEHLYRYHGPGILKCIALADGQPAYSEKLPGVSTSISPVATTDGLIYFASAGKSCVIKAGPKFEIVGTSDLGDPNVASPAVSEGRIYLRGTRYLWCIGKRGG